MAARKIVCAGPALRYTRMLLGCLPTNNLSLSLSRVYGDAPAFPPQLPCYTIHCTVGGRFLWQEQRVSTCPVRFHYTSRCVAVHQVSDFQATGGLCRHCKLQDRQTACPHTCKLTAESMRALCVLLAFFCLFNSVYECVADAC